jgi:nucleoside 2-deoxyribosyltransferase
MTKPKPFAFVLMPFGTEFDDIYRLGIQETAKEKGVVAERVDEQIYTESILERIYRQIDSADFIIADMTGKNPNVFYEVGYAHAKEKICTLITQNSDDIPFDLKHHRHLVYDGSITNLKKMLGDDIEWVKAELERRRTITFEVTARPQNQLLTSSEYARTGTFELVIDIHNRTEKRSPEIDALYLYTSERWEIKQDGKRSGHTKSEREDVSRRHILVTPTNRLAQGAWTQVRCELETSFWRKWHDESIEAKDEYRVQGFMMIEISTAEGIFPTRVDLNVQFDEIPF